ncbi:MAG: DJ-1/PfpI family protein [Elusimicrobiota bacterium]
MSLSGKKILFVTAPQNFRDEEYFEPKEILSGQGAEIVTASLVTGDITGAKGGKAKSDVIINNVKAVDYEGIVFVGGPGAQVFWNNPSAQKIAQDAASQGKVLGAICMGPGTLLKAGVLKGKNATAFMSLQGDFSAAGANYTGKAVEQDGKIITANGPEAARDFGNALLVELSK